MASLFQQLGSSLTDVSNLGGAANRESINRQNIQRIGQARARNRGMQFAALSQLLNIGGSLFDNFKSNQDMIEFAKERGFETSTSKFANTFGTPKFTRNGQDFDRSFIMTIKQLERFKEQKNLLDELEMGGS